MGRRLLSTMLPLALLGGCSDYGDDPTANGPMEPPAATVSFAVQIQPIFDANCIGCHGDGGNAGLDLRSGRSFTNLVEAPSTESELARIEPGEPENSWLYLKITGQQTVGDRMPPGSPLSIDTTNLVRAWIEEGARDN